MSQENKPEGSETMLEDEKLDKMVDGTNDDLREMIFNNGDMVDLKGDGVFNETLGESTPNDQIANDIADSMKPTPLKK